MDIYYDVFTLLSLMIDDINNLPPPLNPKVREAIGHAHKELRKAPSRVSIAMKLL